MCADDTIPDPTPETNDNPSDTSQDTPEDTSKSGSIWSWPRRRFLQAAALGAAAAAFLNAEGGNISLGPLAAYANDLSTSPCTAQDVTVLGIGKVVNYCACSATQTTFNAVVNFTVQNTASADRCCVGLHLVDGTVNGRVVVPAQDVVLTNITPGTPETGTTCIPGKSTVTMQGTISGFPCNDTSIVTFGAGTCGSITTGKCAAGTCSTVAWNTNTASANCTSLDQSPPGGQCRHETICVQGFGVTLTCSSGCPATCGGTITLQLAGVGGQTPYTFSLTDSSGNSFTPSSTTTTTATYSISLSASTTFTGTVTDATGCAKPVQLAETVTPISVALTAGSPDCSGNVTFTATPSTTGTFTYAWTVDGTAVGTNSNTYAYPPNTDCNPHTVAVTATSSGGCRATNSKSITQTVSTQIT